MESCCVAVEGFSETFETNILAPELEVETHTEVMSHLNKMFAKEVKDDDVLRISMHGSQTKARGIRARNFDRNISQPTDK